AQVKAYEILTAEAAVKGDRDAAYQALLAHPLGPPANQISHSRIGTAISPGYRPVAS
ncbi:MAG: hypothetical protein R6X18_10565, partial [Chloroflexota bacterium]